MVGKAARRELFFLMVSESWSDIIAWAVIIDAVKDRLEGDVGDVAEEKNVRLKGWKLRQLRVFSNSFPLHSASVV